MSLRRRYIALGLLVFLLTLVVLAPASLLTSTLGRTTELALSRVTGSLWHGQADIAFRSEPLGRLSWKFQPSSLLYLAVSYDIDLSSPDHHFSGRVTRHIGDTTMSGRAVVENPTINRLLKPYDIAAPGELTLENIALTLTQVGEDTPPTLQAKGDLHWSGGLVTYRLSGRRYETRLPPIVGYIDTIDGKPEITTYRENDDTPLILASIDRDGWLTLGITRAFTRLAAQPWPGSEPDHAVVLEVEEKVF